MDLALTLLLATLIGLTLGAVGGGGSILAVTVLVGVVGLSVTEATTASLLVVGTAAVIGLLSEIPARRRGDTPVKVAAGLVFGLTGIGGAVVGTNLVDVHVTQGSGVAVWQALAGPEQASDAPTACTT